MSISVGASLSSIAELPEYITVKQIERTYGLPRSSLHRYIKTENFPRGIQVGANAVRYRKSEVNAWYENRPPAPVHVMDEDAA